MSTPTPYEPPADFADPRLAPDLQTDFWPRCNGGEPPPFAAADRHERRCIEFLAGYYQVNVLNQRLLTARASGAAEAEIRSLLDAVQEATDVLDALEDRYAAVGFFGEPAKMDGAFYRDVTFVRPEMPRMHPEPSSHSAHVRIPGLEEIPESELRGPVRVLRWNPRASRNPNISPGA